MRNTFYLAAIVMLVSSVLLQAIHDLHRAAYLEPSHCIFLVILLLVGVLSVMQTGNKRVEPSKLPARFSRPFRPALESRFANAR